MITTEGNESLRSRIAEINAETQKWLDEAPGRWAGMLTDDLAHWYSYGVFDGAQLDHYLAVSDAWELHRSVYGYKANWARMMALTSEELEAEVRRMRETAEEDARWEEERRQKELAQKAALDKWKAEHVRRDDEKSAAKPMVSLAMAFGGL